MAEGLEEKFVQSATSFRQETREVQWALFQAQALPGGERRHWSSVLLIKISLIAQSIAHLCPDRNNPAAPSHWDFSSLASLARNLFEAAAFFNYISEAVDDQTFSFRVLLMEINDCANRRRIFEQLELVDQVQLGTEHLKTFQDEMMTNTVFLGLALKVQQKVLQGFSPTLISLRDRVGQSGISSEIWGVYDYLSTHAHTFPVSFFRVATYGRMGKENDAEKTLLATLLPTLAALLNKAVAAYKLDHQELVVFQQRPEH